MATDDFDLLFDRDEALAGNPTKRAATLLFLIQSRTAHLVARARTETQRFVTEKTARDRDAGFIEAFAFGTDPPVVPTIQDLERYAEQWAPLVPQNPASRAAIAHRLGSAYTLAHASVPGIRSALGLDTAPVQTAYRRLYREPLDTIFATRLGRRERLRWRWAALVARIEGLSPFWTSYALTLTETVGATILALPIALSAIGPLGGLIAVIAIGLINVATLAFVAEAVARSGRVHHGGSVYIGGIIQDFLGRTGSLFVSVLLFLLLLLILPAFYLGVATTIRESVGLPAPIGVAALFLVGVYFLRKESLNATVATALIVGAVNISLVVSFCLLAATHLSGSNLTFSLEPVLGSGGFDISAVALVFGVVMASYFGHTSAVLCGRLVLSREPSGRALLRGCIAAQATAIFLYCLFFIAVTGAVDPSALADEAGTVLIPLAQEVGPVVLVLGSIFVILGMGMGTIHFSLALFSLVRERLPSPRREDAPPPGLSLLHVLELNDERAAAVALMLRERSIDAAAVAGHTGLDRSEARAMLRSLVQDGLATETETPSGERYSAVVTPRRARALPDQIWAAMDLDSPDAPARDAGSPLRRSLEGLGVPGRFVLSAAPVLIAFVIAEWMLISDSGSFTGILSFLGVIAVTLVTGIFPVLLLKSSRRKGERSPVSVYGWLTHPLVLAALYAFFLLVVLLHGLVIWENPWERFGAIAACVSILAATFAMKRRNAFAPRATVEVRSDPEGDRTIFEVTLEGRPYEAVVDLHYQEESRTLNAAAAEIPRFGSLRRATFRFDAMADGVIPEEVKVWAHQTTVEGGSFPIAARVRIGQDGDRTERDIEETSGQVIAPLQDGDGIEVAFD